jgi:endogenous inhibitor of DNA gyrase (YacG/DUF329 family)
MEIPFEIPVDDEGYFRRQCPQCEREFKLQYQNDDGSTEEATVFDVYCPYCGISSPNDQFWTNAQVETIQAVAGRFMLDDLSRRGFTVSRNPPPPPLIEQNDMSAVASPCHPDEPLKILEPWIKEIYCPTCGKTFVL